MRDSLAWVVPVVVGLAGSIVAIQSHAHGWAEFPNARQNICYENGGFWSGVGSAIPNKACKAAYDKSGTYPFQQRNEFSANVADYNNIAAVKATVKDGLLCSGGSQAKAGMDAPHAEWQKIKITLDANGQIDYVFKATAVHNPSFWEFYLSKPSYNPALPLTWDDLELVDRSGNVVVGADSKFRIKVKLPANRTGDAVFFTRWQRIDAAGEGFYNCSDITFNSGSNPGDPTPPDSGVNGLNDIGFFIATDFATAAVGDTVRFRTFTASGTETADERLLITGANLSLWQSELAIQINSNKKGELAVGIWNANTEQYDFNSQNVFANRVYAKAPGIRNQLSLIKGEEVVPPPVEPPVSSDAWSAGKVYTADNLVKHNGRSWKAQWWTKGDEPGTTGEWGVWREEASDGGVPGGESGSSAWDAGKTYTQGKVASHKGSNWEAQWWTRDEEPGTTGEWGVWRKK